MPVTFVPDPQHEHLANPAGPLLFRHCHILYHIMTSKKIDIFHFAWMSQYCFNQSIVSNVI